MRKIKGSPWFGQKQPKQLVVGIKKRGGLMSMDTGKKRERKRGREKGSSSLISGCDQCSDEQQHLLLCTHRKGK